MGKRPAPFSYANIGDVCTMSASDSVMFENDSTNNPKGYSYFYPYILTTATFTGLDINGTSRTLTSVPAHTLVPIPFRRVNATALTGTMLALIPL